MLVFHRVVRSAVAAGNGGVDRRQPDDHPRPQIPTDRRPQLGDPQRDAAGRRRLRLLDWFRREQGADPHPRDTR
jgi:hypothetical protein